MRLPNPFRVVLLTCGLLAALTLQGCGGGGGDDNDPAPDTTAPTVPQNLVATPVSMTAINLAWSASTDSGGAGLAGYRVLRAGVQIATTTQTSYSDTGLTANTAYSYTVRAYDGATPANISADSTAASATTLAPDTTAPTVAQNLTATAIGPTQVNLTWSASTDGGTGVAGYRILRGGTQIGSTATTVFSDTGLTAGTAYAYTVRAFDNATPANVSADSNVANVTTPVQVDTTPPTVPQNLVATAASATQVNLTWTASTDAGSGVAGYRVFRGGAQIATTAATNYSNTGLTPSTAYSYTVRAFDSATPANVSADSNVANVTTLAQPDTTPPTVPQNLVATAASATQVNLAWTASTDAGSGVAGYRVFRGGTQIATTTVTSYSNTGLTPSTAYSYTVRAFDNATPANVSADSNVANATTLAVVSGLDTRPSNTTCLAGAKPTGADTASVARVFPALSFTSPILALQAPGSGSRWFVVQQGGSVRQFSSVAGTSTTTSFVDITARVTSGGETGLLGMAFHPNFPADRRVFLSYTATSGSLVSRISSFMTTDNGQTLDPNSERILLTLNQPESNHNGGNIAFGPDGFLYIGFGDGGSGGDPHTQNGPIGNGQSLTTMLGKILRIDVGAESATTYTIPSSNPFAGNPKCGPLTNAQSCPEIYAYGVRNPWRWSFDRQSGQLWLGDVGQDAWEEVDIVVKGGNYGWRCREGLHNFGNQTGCPTSGYVSPVAEYDHSLGASITGGYVYRGPQTTAFSGRYIFGDFGSGRMWVLLPDAAGGFTRTDLITNSGLAISSFAQANDGELYVLDYSGGLYRLVFQPGAGGGVIPSSLAATGCVDATNPTRPASGLIPYAVNAPFWSDGAVKDRWVALPNGQNISTAATSGDWDFPNGTVLVKNFTLNSLLVETRLFMHHTDGSWAGYSYQWNDAQTDATLVTGGATKSWNGQAWIYPSEANCLQCHTAVAGRSLGLETAQMNRDFTYPQTGRTANQITTLNAISTLTPAITADPATLPSIPDPAGASGSLAERARSYLHTNCSQCHRPGGPTPVNMDLRYTTALSAMNTCNVTPTTGDLGIGAAARIIAPGSATNSVLVARVNRRNDAKQMPPVGSNQIDTAGVALLTQWINGLANCN